MPPIPFALYTIANEYTGPSNGPKRGEDDSPSYMTHVPCSTVIRTYSNMEFISVDTEIPDCARAFAGRGKCRLRDAGNCRVRGSTFLVDHQLQSRSTLPATRSSPSTASPTLYVYLCVTMSKKGAKMTTKEQSYEFRDVVLAKVRGYPPWPGMVSTHTRSRDSASRSYADPDFRDALGCGS